MDEGYVRASGCVGGAAGLVTFLLAWAWSVEHGGFWGFLLGWIPAAIVGSIVGAAVAIVWPLILLGLIAIAFFAWRSLQPA